MIKSLGVAVTAAFFACVFSFAPACAADREPVRVRVSLIGLELASSEGRAALDGRIRSAARRACAVRSVDLAARRDALRCRSDMIGDGGTQVAALGGGTTGEMASAAR